MDIQQLQEIQKSYRSKKVLGEQAQKTLDACKRGMADDAYAFSEGLTEYLNKNFKRKWIRWKNPLNPETEFFKFAICFEQSGRNVSVLCSQELDVSYKGDVPRVKHFRYSECFPMTMDCKDCSLTDFSTEPVDEKRLTHSLNLQSKFRRNNYEQVQRYCKQAPEDLHVRS